MTSGDDLVARARLDGEAFAAGGAPPAAAMDALRAECAELFDALPEPPPYRRASDPARARAAELIDPACNLLARLFAAIRTNPGDGRLAALTRATELHLRALAAVANGDIAAGEELVRDAWRAARVATGTDALLDAHAPAPPVFDRATGTSRYDPRPEPTLTLQLLCPNEGCRQPAAYAIAPRHAVHRFTCQHCARPFTGHFLELRRLDSRSTGKAVHYSLRGTPLGGTETLLEFDDASGRELAAVSRDLLALLYAATGTLTGVLNITTGAVLWVVPKPACFIATAAYGPEAPELEVFRAFRDRALMPSRAGRMLVRAYYAIGPGAARLVAAHPALRAMTRSALDRVLASLRRSAPVQPRQ